MSKHTPGPWRCWQTPGYQHGNHWRIRTSPHEQDGDTLQGYCGEANARLIAAAPDLLEACREADRAISPESRTTMRDWNQMLKAATKQLRAAIAKAEGNQTGERSVRRLRGGN